MPKSNEPKILSRLESALFVDPLSGSLDIHRDEDLQRVEIHDITSINIHDFVEIVFDSFTPGGTPILEHIEGSSSNPESNWKISHEFWGIYGDYWVRTVMSIPMSDITTLIYVLEEYANSKKSTAA